MSNKSELSTYIFAEKIKKFLFYLKLFFLETWICFNFWPYFKHLIEGNLEWKVENLNPFLVGLRVWKEKIGFLVHPAQNLITKLKMRYWMKRRLRKNFICNLDSLAQPSYTSSICAFFPTYDSSMHFKLLIRIGKILYKRC